ncbi:zinc finger family protein [Striga asiatica]|uniref:Zinc finger family protein n=1 Tax=Striga asiatica TaxID=4170 RepID=A0A5A7R2N2_STRAF|nr:zinc finger family protein [Striga asiatica]
MDYPSSPNQSVSDLSSKDHTGPSEPGPNNEGPGFPQPENDREYGCKYCEKKFSNKQALGGHQNAHKVQRAVEKSAQEMHQNVSFGPFPYYGTGPMMAYPGMGPFLASYGRSHGLVLQRPGGPFTGYPYGPGFGRYPGWDGPGPTNVPRFLGQGLRNQGPNVRFLDSGAGSSGYSRPVIQDSTGSRINNHGNDTEPEDDSGLDLSLKL